MSAGALLIGFLNVALYCAIIILVAFVILWVLGWMGIVIDGNVLKWGKIVIGLLCLIVIVGWLLSVIGGGGHYSGPIFFRS
jgi:hypothetical protein